MKDRLFSLTTIIMILVAVVMLFELSDLDAYVQQYLYNAESNSWLIDRDEPILHFILYSGIKKLFIMIVLMLLFLIILFRKVSWVKNNLKGLIIVVMSCFVIPLTVGAIKGSTNMPCPNQIVEFGGDYTKIGLFEKADQSKDEINFKCYPAGHASGGFALLSLLFLFKSSGSKRVTLISVLALSWSIATYKMFIGDHFLSHTIVTMLLSWIIVLIIVRFVNYTEGRYFTKDI